MKEKTDVKEIFLVEELYKLEVEKKNFNWVEFLTKLMK